MSHFYIVNILFMVLTRHVCLFIKHLPYICNSFDISSTHKLLYIIPPILPSHRIIRCVQHILRVTYTPIAIIIYTAIYFMCHCFNQSFRTCISAIYQHFLNPYYFANVTPVMRLRFCEAWFLGSFGSHQRKP